MPIMKRSLDVNFCADQDKCSEALQHRFFGYAVNQKGIKCYNDENDKLHVSWKVIFLKKKDSKDIVQVNELAMFIYFELLKYQ